MTAPFNFTQLLQNAKSLMEKTEENLKNLTATAEGGAGLVTVTVNAEHHITALQIDEELLQESKATIEEIITLTVNDAQRKVDSQRKDSMGALNPFFENLAEDTN